MSLHMVWQLRVMFHCISPLKFVARGLWNLKSLEFIGVFMAEFVVGYSENRGPLLNSDVCHNPGCK